MSYDVSIDESLFEVYPEIKLGLMMFKADVKAPDDAFWNYMEALYDLPEAYCLNQPAMAVQGGKQNDCFSLADTADQNVIMETIKRAEDGKGWIVRMYECDNARTKTSLYWNRPVAAVEECNGLEEKQSELAFIPRENGGAEIPFVIKPFEIKTFRILEK